MTAHRRNIIAGSVVLAALLLALIAPNFRRGAASLAHPDPVGPTAYSKSAIGHLALYRLLGELGIFTSTSESGSGAHVGPGDILVIAEPRTDDATLDEVRAMLTARTVLLVLPKRGGAPDSSRPYWLSEDKLLSHDAIAKVLHLADPAATLVRDADPPAGASIHQAQLIYSQKLRPLLVTAGGGMLMAERRTGERRLVVLSDPDLIANHGLARGDNSVIAVNLIEKLRAGRPGVVIFDEFIHGFSPKPFHLLGILFQFPFVLVTAQMAIAVVLLSWASTAQFGAPVAPPPAMDAGKRSLIDTGARLLAHTGRIPELSERYFEEMVRDTGRRLRAPRGLDLPTLTAWLGRTPGAPPAPLGPTAPRHIWNWRKELLGEPRPHTKLD